jgi:hypothetical protein
MLNIKFEFLNSKQYLMSNIQILNGWYLRIKNCDLFRIYNLEFRNCQPEVACAS